MSTKIMKVPTGIPVLDAKFSGKYKVMEEPEFRKLAAPMERPLRKADQPRPAEKTE